MTYRKFGTGWMVYAGKQMVFFAATEEQARAWIAEQA